eukprot:scaffold222057_cov17-Prasinocladus_malaysianus.AAC.1
MQGGNGGGVMRIKADIQPDKWPFLHVMVSHKGIRTSAIGLVNLIRHWDSSPKGTYMKGIGTSAIQPVDHWPRDSSQSAD